ncbi:putative mg2+ transporter protein [Eutypa lata UCREL1]|uniref:Putative mg2+ transporter protein n=1 Tax=Eutypa lata (strain UCR-EL1) TaxID=1287681 RepID=M7T1H8_EUTLA|nr:putative mg2+ transporter protein [Eutypa lata UCREL1]
MLRNSSAANRNKIDITKDRHSNAICAFTIVTAIFGRLAHANRSTHLYLLLLTTCTAMNDNYHIFRME